MDFETMIRAAMREGASLEDIAGDVGAVLNKIQGEGKTNSKQKALNQWLDGFNECYSNDKVTISDVATLAALICAEDYPNWTIKDLESYRSNVENNLIILAEMQGKPTREIFSDMLKPLIDKTEDLIKKW